MRKLYSEIIAVCDNIEASWQGDNYSSDTFYQHVLSHTESLDLSALGEISSQLEMLNLPEVRILQQGNTFSDLYIQLYNNGRFWIEILNWWGGHVNIHDHDFSGIQFQLKGSALNILYDFRCEEQLGAVQLGQASVRDAKIWRCGERSIVRHGQIDPHAVFHIDKPSTSLIIRTIPTKRYGAQRNIFSECAGHYYVNDDIHRKQLTAMNLLAQSSGHEFRKHAKRLLGEQSLAENLFMLIKLDKHFLKDKFNDLIEEYSTLGESQSKVVRSAIRNNCSDYFISQAHEMNNERYREKVALFALAASYSLDDYASISQGINDCMGGSLYDDLQLVFMNMDARELNVSEAYLRVMGFEGLIEKKHIKIISS